MNRFFSRLMWLALGVVAMSLTGCTFCVEPLSDANTSVPDLRLVGSWDESWFTVRPPDGIRVINAPKKDSPNVLDAENHPKGSKAIGYLKLFCTKIGNDCVVSAQPASKDDKGVVWGGP